MKKIVLIGPVYPYKGGISHYTGMLYRALSKKYDMSMVSFKLQYPKILYKKEQKEYTNNGFEVEETDYLINTINPLNWIRAANKIKKLQPDFIICQWWHPYFAPCFLCIRKLLRNFKWLFLCHNVFPHEQFPMDKTLTKQVLKTGDCFIVQSKMDLEDLRSIVPNPRCKLTVHPTYNAFKFENMNKQLARQKLMFDDETKIILFFGFVREYKGLKYLISALSQIKKALNKVKLLIVGDFSKDKEQYLDLIKKNKLQEEIKIVDGYVPDREVEKYFAACDLVALPYVSATQSGIVQIAYGFEKPVIATNVGGLPDVVIDGKTGYLVEPRNPEQIADAIIRYFIDNKEMEFSENVAAEAYRFSWDRMVEVVEELYK